MTAIEWFIIFYLAVGAGFAWNGWDRDGDELRALLGQAGDFPFAAKLVIAVIVLAIELLMVLTWPAHALSRLAR
jgi:hypothetical protein